ncbi:hypothetical protein HNP84_001580 [Thermocatellispora tengchongensis]|uniref:Cache domain-containing protein n=1 Tax=Thermocatellispora tengchongensis TaxID=1073253 RepID=A0A840P3P5_9ACTN|nr:cache domain-containing protein [Thermocatellispora tengchongensis]MBB5131867.1 hypothetical protein [Thermocatellispora tengchongensis]
MTYGPDDERGAAEQALEGALKAVRELLAGVFAAPRALADEVVRARREVLAAGRPYDAAELARIKPLILEWLDAMPAAHGLGLLASPALLPGRERHIEWWQRGVTGYVPLKLNLDPTSVDVYDYFQTDWYAAARDHGRRAIFGPYVDYSGADRYICTFSVPVADEGTLLGVAAADVRMGDLEPRLLRLLRTAGRDAVLVGPERRVVAANCARWLVGSRLPRLPEPGDGTFAAVGEVGGDSAWTLALAGRAGS